MTEKMKTLCLMRHAEAEKGGDDHARPLTAHGISQARKAAQWLQEQGIRPDFIISSDAVRTRQTADIIGPNPQLTRDLYLAEAQTIFDLIPQDFETVLIMAHNPGIYELALRLAGKNGEELLGMPTATIAVFSQEKLVKVFIAD